MNLIADEKIFCESPNPSDVFCFTPGLTKLANGRLLATYDFGGPGVGKLAGVHSKTGDYSCGNQCHALISDDDGFSWRETGEFPMLHARGFTAGGKVYVMGHGGGIRIVRSDDNGETWGASAIFEEQYCWGGCAVPVDHFGGKIYTTMERILKTDDWPADAPVLMSADENADLTRRENWRMSAPFVYEENVALPTANGIPFYPQGILPGTKSRFCGSPGWLEVNLVRLHDPDHLLYDQANRSLLLVMRAHTGMTNIAAIAQGRDNEDGSLTINPVNTPAGNAMYFIPFPGGQMKFQITYDEISKLYWLVSTQATDSMTRGDKLPDNRYGLPDNERHRLALYFSKNLFDWCFAGMIAIGETAADSRHYASAVIVKNDLLVLSRSADSRAPSPHNSNKLTLHRVRDFRKLIY